MQLLLKSIVTSLIFILGSAAWADDDSDNMCACFCVDGSLKTLCTDVEDAQDDQRPAFSMQPSAHAAAARLH